MRPSTARVCILDAASQTIKPLILAGKSIVRFNLRRIERDKSAVVSSLAEREGIVMR